MEDLLSTGLTRLVLLPGPPSAYNEHIIVLSIVTNVVILTGLFTGPLINLNCLGI